MRTKARNATEQMDAILIIETLLSGKPFSERHWQSLPKTPISKEPVFPKFMNHRNIKPPAEFFLTFLH